ncbi:MAG: autotransporter-associated beta strand repeat-containing protein [Kiritimatiellales bacterium]|nr:autotransporter-associated beta strand repeat-containing protein [Kiritimatiellales bacterium]
MNKRIMGMLVVVMGLGFAAQAAVTNQWNLLSGNWSDVWNTAPIPQNIDDVALLSGNIGGSRFVTNELATLTLGGLEIGRKKTSQQRNVTLSGNAITFESTMGTAFLYKPVDGTTLNQKSIVNTDIILKSNLAITNVHTGVDSYLQLNGSISEAGGVRSITINDAGSSVIMAGTNSSYSGGTTLNSGTLSINNKNALGTGSLTIGSSSTAVFGMGNNTLTNNIINEGVMTQNGNGKLTGDISGSGNLTHTGTGFTLNLSGNNAGFSGSISNSGTINIGHENAMGTGTVYLGDGVHVGNISKAVGGGFYLTGDHAISNNIVLLNDGNTIGNNQAPMELAGVISGAYNLTKTGIGKVILSGNNTYSGGITVSGGTLVGNADGAFGSGNVTLATSTNIIVTLVLTNGLLNNYIADTATLIMDTNAILNLDFIGTPDTVAAISLDGGTNFLADGIYDAAALATAGGNGIYTGTGSLKIGVGGVTSIGSVAIGLLPGGANLALSWSTTNGAAYGVQTNIDLVNGTWGTAQTVIGNGGTLVVTNGLIGPKGFFRIISE